MVGPGLLDARRTLYSISLGCETLSNDVWFWFSEVLSFTLVGVGALDSEIGGTKAYGSDFTGASDSGVDSPGSGVGQAPDSGVAGARDSEFCEVRDSGVGTAPDSGRCVRRPFQQQLFPKLLRILHGKTRFFFIRLTWIRTI